jgi:polyisoprenyl-teichoic acid--peptidoglycan teichoic acid transferase
MSTLKRILLLLFLLPALSCSMPAMVSPSPTAPQIIVQQLALVQAPVNSTATPTPFQPLALTPTYIPTDFPTPVPSSTPTPRMPTDQPKTWKDYPGPSVPPDIEVPPPVGLLAQPRGQINIMLLGSDQRTYDYGFRTDTILLLTLNPSTGTANLTSFPRDLYVYIPGWTVQRINTAFPHGGFSTLAQTMEYNFGVKPDYYVLVNFQSFQQVIDSLGGIDVHVAVSLTDERTGHGYYTLPAGVRHMNGELALWFVRSRHTSSDFERTQRQQEVIQALFMKMLSINAVTRAPEIYKIYKKNVETDMPLDAITPLLPLAVKLSDTSRIHQYFISRSEVYNWRTTQGAAVLVPIRENVVKVMRQALNSKEVPEPGN